MGIVKLILRLGTALTFIGHGIFALQVRDGWIKFLTTTGIPEAYAPYVMQCIGGLDLLVALLILFKPFKPVLIWAFIWALATAIIRPLSGESIIEFIERGANWAAPLALLLVYYRDEED